MTGAAYITSRSTGHGEYLSRVTSQGSDNVIINGNGAHRQGDGWPVHCNPLGNCHTGTTSSGSSSVFVNDRSLARIGDSISCGGSIATGSDNVLVGD